MKERYLLDLSAALPIKSGTKIVPALRKTAFLSSRYKNFSNINKRGERGGGGNKVRRGKDFRKLIIVPLVFGSLD